MSWAEEQDWFGLEDLAIMVQQRRDYASELLTRYGIWLTANGSTIPLHDMSDSHIENCIKMIEEGRLNREWALPYLKREQERRAHG